MDTFFQEMLGGAGRLQENVGVTLFLNDTDKKNMIIYSIQRLLRVIYLEERMSACVCMCVYG